MPLGSSRGRRTRQVQVEFLLHLDEFDRRRAYLDLGFGSLWEYCREALHLREGAAGRRINAMRVLRRFPALAGALRDGRLCLSTLSLLGQVLTEESADELVARAAYRSTAEVDHLVASLRPRPAPREGIRKLPELRETSREVLPPLASPPSREEAPAVAALIPAPAELLPVLLDAPRRHLVEVRPVSRDQWSLRAAISRSFKDDLERLAMLLGHTVRRGDLAAVLHEAVRCGIEKHGKRKGAVRPERKVAPKASPGKDPAVIPAEVRRQVWERDGGRCAWVGPDGKRCGSRWQLEVDHVRPPSRGGVATLGNLRLACKQHNLLHAEEVYGRAFMRKYRKGESTIDVGGTLLERVAGEATRPG